MIRFKQSLLSKNIKALNYWTFGNRNSFILKAVSPGVNWDYYGVLPAGSQGSVGKTPFNQFYAILFGIKFHCHTYSIKMPDFVT